LKKPGVLRTASFLCYLGQKLVLADSPPSHTYKAIADGINFITQYGLRGWQLIAVSNSIFKALCGRPRLAAGKDIWEARFP